MGQEKPEQLADLAHIKPHVHEHCRLGKANKECLRYQWLQQVLPDVHNTSMERLQRDPAVTHPQKCNLLRYWMGVIYNQRHAKLWGRTTDASCPLCGCADGGHHMLSGCKAMAGMIQERHNAAGRMISAAVAEGELGASLIFTDVGNKEKMQAALEEQETHGRVQRAALKTMLMGAAARELEAWSFPDAMLVTPLGQHAGPAKDIPAHRRHLVFVEIKYVRDTDPSKQLAAAKEQHAPLMDALTRGGHCAKAELVTILLGVGGTVYTSNTVDPLKRLGVHGHALDTLIARLQRHAAQTALALVTSRRAAEHARGTNTGRPAGAYPVNAG